ncbi:alternate-type signal peptide domain-containing protein [Nocardioides donggukensis]|uniref:Alternate-type signal peptide domain-containing protein n=1 Tax=Nocardioides donggukensis TaxID=2774019 RepID=A0A927K6S8_9ACTN|nr:alternate-type signal peptide domain-containing protein [Nocardioides donggukensis]MBD8870918.1 alternate-type signal peptide domain-containing protein [Nocardioides donggukensis]
MRNSTKGAVAAATAGVLLLGGAGSLAYWSDAVTIGGSTISSGQMSLDDTTGDADSCAAADWILDGDEATADAVFGTGSTLVPGDVITKECTFDVNAVGDHLRATLATTGGASTGDLAAKVTTAASFTIGDATITEITEGNDGEELKATITVTFPYGAEDNTSQDLALELSDYTVSLTQVHN